MKPLWLLDVDGVINAVMPKPKHLAAWGNYTRIRARGGGQVWSITYSPALVLGIKELMEDGLVEVQWLTTWQEDANHLVDTFDWPQLEVASTRDEYLGEGPEGWWKLTTAKRVAGSRPLIWTDDDLMDEEAGRWVKERSTLWPTLAVCPSYRGGLQPSEYLAIEQFCKEHRG